MSSETRASYCLIWFSRVKLDVAFFSISVKVLINFVAFSLPLFLTDSFSLSYCLAVEIEALIDATAKYLAYFDVLIVSFAVFSCP